MATTIYSNSKKLDYSANSSSGYQYTFALNITRDTQNITSNYTPTTATVKLTSPASRWDTSASYGQLSVTLYWIKEDGTYGSKTATGDKIYESAYNTTYSVSVSQNVPHLNDGTSKVYAIGKWTSSASNSYRPSSTSLTSDTIDLPTIPRASTISPTETQVLFTLPATIKISRNVDSYTDTLTWVGYTPIDEEDGSYNLIGTPSDTVKGTVYDETTGTLCEKTSLNEVTWKIPEELSSLIPEKELVGVKITCTTYNGDTVVGTNECWIYARLTKEIANPLVIKSYEETNEKVISQLGTNDLSIPVLNVSQPKFTFSATPRYNSTIKSLTVTCGDGQSSSTSPHTFNAIGSSVFTVVAIDSRGFPTTITVDLSENEIPYIKPTIKALSPLREAPTSGEIILNANGDWYGGTMIDDIENPLNIAYKCKVFNSEEDATLIDIPSDAIVLNEEENKWSITDYSLGTITKYNKNYKFTLFVSDYYTDLEQSKTISKGISTFNAGEHDFQVNGDLYVADEDGKNKQNVLNAMLNVVYPIGIIVSLDVPTNPADLFGIGTWERVKGVFLFAGIDDDENYAPGKSGGEFSHTLIESELPEITGTLTLYNLASATSSGTGKFTVSAGATSSYTGLSANSRTGTKATYAFGGGQAHNNMPPFYSVYKWKRVS